jgi:hypothetical protein
MKRLALALAVALVSSRAAAEDDVKVKLGGGREVVLERHIEGTDLWESLCVGQCMTFVPREGQYRLNGPGVRPSLPIALVTSSTDGAVHLDAHVGYSYAVAGGAVMVILGPLVMFGSSIALLTSNSHQDTPFCSSGNCVSGVPQNISPDVAGAAALTAGAIVTVAGAIALALSLHTHTSQQLAVSPRGITIRF